MVLAQSLKRVVKNGRVAALPQRLEKLANRRRRMVADARQKRNSKELEWLFRDGHRMISSNLESASATSAGPRRENWARVALLLPTRMVIPLRAAANAGSSEKSSPK